MQSRHVSGRHALRGVTASSLSIFHDEVGRRRYMDVPRTAK